jgi:hypothetical protein
MQTETLALAHDRRFFALMALAALLTVFAGFAPSYYLQSVFHVTTAPNGRPLPEILPPVVHVHAVIFSLWIVVFGVQAGLVATGHVATHRRLGVAAAFLIPTMVITAVLTAIRGGRDGWNPGGPYADALGFMLVGLADITVFSTLATAGVYFRRRPELHRRLMLYATLGGLMWPAITRTWFIAPRLPAMFALLASLLFIPVVRDFWRRSPARWVSLSLAVAILATIPLRAAVARTETWHHVAAWLIR